MEVGVTNDVVAGMAVTVVWLGVTNEVDTGVDVTVVGFVVIEIVALVPVSKVVVVMIGAEEGEKEGKGEN